MALSAETIAAVELWCTPNMQRASSELLGVADAGVTEMMLMANPAAEHG